MTLQYKLLGKPGNLEEFVEIAKQKGEARAEIRELAWCRNRDVLDGTYEISLQSGPTRFSIKGYQDSFIIDGGESVAFSKAYVVAANLEQKGLLLNVLGMTLEEAKKENEKLYDRWCEGLRSFR